MKIGIYFITYNRPKVLAQSLSSAFQNTEIKPSECWVIDDGSKPNLQKSLLQFSLENSTQFPVNLILHGVNYGVGYSFERVYNLIKQNDDIDIACIMESDYIWRKDWLSDTISVFESSEHTIAIAGTDHPDMYDKNKTHYEFPKIMIELFGQDLESRESLYKSYDLQTKTGKIKVQGVSNSCGCMIIHVKRLKNIIKDLESNKIVPVNDFWERMDKAFHKKTDPQTRKTVNDGWMSSTISKYGEMHLQFLQKNTIINHPMISICDYSISEHLCGDGLNGKIVPEGETFINSPSWKTEFLQTNPR